MIDHYFTLYQKMKNNGVVLYGAGTEGELAISVLSEEKINIIAVSDKAVDKRVGDFVTISLDKLLSIDKNVVCIVTPKETPKSEWEKCEEHFETVVNNMLIHIIKYFLPDGNRLKCFPFNHYEAPYHSGEEILNHRPAADESMLDIDFNLEYQESFLNEILGRKEEFKDFLKGDIRYKIDNGYFNYVDAFVYFSVIKYHKPKRIIEIGSGFSTCLALDINEKYGYDIKISSIEPYPDRLYGNIRDNEKNLFIKQDFVQNMDIDFFRELKEGDILFIDSSHVAKEGGDVLYEYFQILPRLNSGVIIHIHDILKGFAYPIKWLEEGVYYNEAYILRALLMNSQRYEILFFSDMYNDNLIFPENKMRGGGGSIYIRKR